MFEDWGEFYLVVGGAAAVLIGLIFVVITLMHDRPRSAVLVGSKLYMGPILLGISFVLALSAAALDPGMDPRTFAAIAAVIAAWGLARGVISISGIRSLATTDDPPHWTDVWFYGVIPCAIYLVLGIVAWMFWAGCPWAQQGIAAVNTAALLIAIRNEWDLITWIAPRSDAPEHK